MPQGRPPHSDAGSSCRRRGKCRKGVIPHLMRDPERCSKGKGLKGQSPPGEYGFRVAARNDGSVTPHLDIGDWRAVGYLAL